MESSCEFVNEPSGCIKCWETIECPNNYRKAYRLLVGKPEGRRALGRPKRRWLDLVEVGWVDVDWIGLAQDRNRWRALVNSVLNLRVHKMLGNYQVCKQLGISRVVLSSMELVS
jgi:predicted small integral membrane protein